MTILVVDAVFIDTNILVYVHLPLSPFYAIALRKLRDFETAGAELWISRQSLREYLSAMTKPGALTGTIPIPSLISDVHYFSSRFHIAEDGPTVTVNLLNLVTTIPMGGKQIHDANIVATMQAHGIRRLFTHNTADFARFASVITIEPLVP